MNVLREKTLYAKLKKYEFWLEKVSFLGHVGNKNGVVVDLAKVKAVVEWERPTKVREISSFLDLVGYYRKFIEGFFALLGPLTAHTRKNTQYEWSEVCEATFQYLKQRLMTAHVLILPNESIGYMVCKDSSRRDWGACLCNKPRLCPIS